MFRRITLAALGLLLAIVSGLTAHAQRPRARQLGVPFEGTPGPLNAITDVAGVEVGHVTLISGSGKLVLGKGPATEEAIVNALVAAETMEGIDGNTVYALPHDRLRTILRKYGRLIETP